MRPALVDSTATPRPPRTRGIFSALVYTRRPGLEMRFTPEMTRARSGEYFISMVSTRPGRSTASATAKSVM